MKITHTILSVFFSFFTFFSQCNAQDAVAYQPNPADQLSQDLSLQSPKITFLEKQYNFQEARVGDIIKKTFYFKNTGTLPLVIYDVQTSCGCTATQWAKEVIQPNQSGKIEVIYDTFSKKEHLGYQKKVIMIISNANNSEEKLILEGTVSE